MTRKHVKTDINHESTMLKP